MFGFQFAFSLKAFSVKHEIKFTKMPSYICIRFLIKILHKDNFKTALAFLKDTMAVVSKSDIEGFKLDFENFSCTIFFKLNTFCRLQNV